MENLKKSSIKEGPTQVMQIDNEPSRMDPLTKYLHEGLLSEDKAKAWRIRNLFVYFMMLKEKLYKQSFSPPLL